MSNFMHAREYLNAGDIVKLNCDTQCNFMIMTDSDFSNYKRLGRYSYYGGHCKMFPTTITAPSSGYWNVVIDLGGGSASIRYELSYLKR